MDQNESGRYFKGVLQQTFDAFYEITVAEIKRLERAGRRRIRYKRMNGSDTAKHRALVRWLLVHRRRAQGVSAVQIAEELRMSEQRVYQMLTEPEPRGRGRVAAK